MNILIWIMVISSPLTSPIGMQQTCNASGMYWSEYCLHIKRLAMLPKYSYFDPTDP